MPEVKHACLGGMYALKAALRYVQTDGADRVAIVVAADIAQYERGSSGEPTQGAGAVAMLVEPRARLLALDLRTAGSSSDERGWDFRKPVARHFMPEYPESCRGERDFPVFNGKYSTVCYVEAVVRALQSAHARGGGDPRSLLAEPAALLLHRPYDRMPVAALGAAWVWACVRAGEREAIGAACVAADVGFDALVAELAGESRVREVLAHGPEFDPLARTQAVARHVVKDEGFARVLAATQPGRALVRQLGNLYTASLPAWIAAAFADAHARAGVGRGGAHAGRLRQRRRSGGVVRTGGPGLARGGRSQRRQGRAGRGDRAGARGLRGAARAPRADPRAARADAVRDRRPRPDVRAQLAGRGGDALPRERARLSGRIRLTRAAMRE
ncbi:hypothetical protein [Nannocystis pusilla]|uniref:hypothetical protein n=1 Tax=Nannocystis pusilla TaxID=889268 RepID=UPI003B7E0F99